MLSALGALLLSQVARWCMAEAVGSTNDRTSLVRRHNHEKLHEQYFSGVEIGQEGHMVQVRTPPAHGEEGHGEDLGTDDVEDAIDQANSTNETDTHGHANSEHGGAEHDPAPSPPRMGLDEEWNETDLVADDRPFFYENTTSTEPPTLDELLNMPHAPHKHFEAQPPDHSICKNTTGIKTNDTREVKWNLAGVGFVIHGEKKKYHESCTFPMGTFPDGRLEECTDAVANSPVCSNFFHLDADTYACACVARELYLKASCKSEDANTTCQYQLNPGEFDNEAAGEESMDDDTGGHFIEEWSSAEQY